jgi:hypothetical protein
MRRYDDLVQVRRGLVPGPGEPDERLEGPAQLLWRDRLWQVRRVLARWVETGPWWSSSQADEVLGLGAGSAPASPAVPTSAVAVLTELEHWRVEAGDAGRLGVLELVLDWSDGTWRLVGCHD